MTIIFASAASSAVKYAYHFGFKATEVEMACLRSECASRVVTVMQLLERTALLEKQKLINPRKEQNTNERNNKCQRTYYGFSAESRKSNLVVN
jgi:hypothetical protein